MIYLQNLHKQFGPKKILKNVNFHLRPGERVGLVGENGTGKTTLFRIIMKTESSDSGKIIFEQEHIDNQKRNLEKNKIEAFTSNKTSNHHEKQLKKILLK